MVKSSFRVFVLEHVGESTNMSRYRGIKTYEYIQMPGASKPMHACSGGNSLSMHFPVPP